MRALLPLTLLFACLGQCGEQLVEIPLHDGEGVVQGRLRCRQSRQYELSASGQNLTVAMDATPPRTLTVKVHDPAGAEMSLQRVGAGRWSAKLRPGALPHHSPLHA